jgi:hypothetical protein
MGWGKDGDGAGKRHKYHNSDHGLAPPGESATERACWLDRSATEVRAALTALGTANLGHFGTRPGSPPGVPGGGITGVTPPPIGGTEMPGSMPAGGQITPFDRDNSSLKLALPVVSPGVDKTKPPVLAWQPKFGAGESNGGAGRSDCACASVTAAIIVSATIIQGRIDTSRRDFQEKRWLRPVVPHCRQLARLGGPRGVPAVPWAAFPMAVRDVAACTRRPGLRPRLQVIGRIPPRPNRAVPGAPTNEPRPRPTGPRITII